MSAPIANARPRFRFAARGAAVPSVRAAQRGSVLVVALLVAALVTLALTSYLTLSTTSTRQAKRSFAGYAALDLAEAGAEEAVWSFNHAVAGDPLAWNAWTTGGTAVWRKFDGFDLGDNATSAVKVYVSNIALSSNSSPVVVTQASVTAPGTAPLTKMIEVTLRRRSLFANGLVAKETITFSGNNASVDSWNSDPDGNPATAAIPYDASVRTDHGSVATLAVVNDAITVNQANIWGYVATGGGQPEVGFNGTVQGVSTPPNVKVDPARISTDFSASLDVIPAPTDGTYISKVGSTLGVVGTTTKWRTPSISLSGNDSLTILGNVTLILTNGSGSDALSVTGNAVITIAPNSSLVIYSEGNLKVAGKGLTNPNVQPVSCQIYGTNASLGGQTAAIVGNGALKCIFYGPNADLKINGNGDVMGAFVARTIAITGNAAFHFDESLGSFGNAAFGLVKWRELTTAADQQQYSSVFSGW